MSRIFKIKENEKGQSLVEFALILPILLLLIMGIIQFGIIFSAQIGITNAAREGARAAAVGHSDIELRVEETLGNHISLELGVTSVDYPNGAQIGQDVTVTVLGRVKPIVPIPNVFNIGEGIPLRAVSTMRLESLESDD